MFSYITQTTTFGGLSGERERIQKDRNDDDRGPPGANGQPSAGAAMFTGGKPKVAGRCTINRSLRGNGGPQTTLFEAEERALGVEQEAQ